jgi:hypothetical protein
MTTFQEIGTLELLKSYRSRLFRSEYKGVPIELRERVLAYYKAHGIKVKLRYRGPRKHNAYRSPNTKQSTCLVSDAKTFAVYKD